MKRLNRNITAFSIVLLVLTACNTENKTKTTISTENLSKEKAQMGNEVEPEVLLENEFVKVLKFTLEPNDFLPKHNGEIRAVYSLSDYSLEWEEEGQKLGEKSWKKGDVHSHEAGRHAAKNNGITTAKWVVFVKKDGTLPNNGKNSLENDVKTVSPDLTELLLDNDNFRIIKVTLPRGKKIPMHSGVSRIIYSLSDYQIKYNSDEESKVEKQFKIGNTHWHKASQHAIENTGNTDAQYLVISIK